VFYCHNLGGSVSNKVTKFTHSTLRNKGDLRKGKPLLLGKQFSHVPDGFSVASFLITASQLLLLPSHVQRLIKQGFPGSCSYILFQCMQKTQMSPIPLGGQSPNEFGSVSNPCSSRHHLHGKSSELWARRLSSARLLFEYPVEDETD
jgi:hypothetical protein